MIGRFTIAMLLAVSFGSAQPAWHFTDVTADAGLSYEHGYTTGPGFREPSESAGGVAAGDYDRDGWVDLYVVRGDDKLSFKGFFTSVPLSPTIDPVANGIRFLLVESTGAIPVDVTIPGGAYSTANKVGWKVNGSATSWTYKNSGNVPLVNGIQKVSLKEVSSAGKFKFGVKGKNRNYAVNSANLPLVGTLVIDVPNATTGQCGEAKFLATPPAKPSCASTSGGRTVKCK